MNEPPLLEERLTGLPLRMRAAGYLPPDYRLIRLAAINALIPARLVRGLWQYNPADTELIAQTLRAPRAASPSEIRQARQSVATA